MTYASPPSPPREPATPPPPPNSASPLGCLLFLAILIGIIGWMAGWFSGPAGPTGSQQAQPRTVSPRGDLTPGEQSLIELFENANPSVAFITTSTRRLSLFSRAPVEVRQGSGSGFVWDHQGHIVTNWHVLQNATAAQVVLNDQVIGQATLVGASPAHDLAVLRVDVPADQLFPLPLGSSHDLRVGQFVLAIGNPFGLERTLTTGVVSALGRQISVPGGNVIEEAIQTDASINPGNSGGPLLDSAGRLIGVNTAIFSPTGASAGIGFAIPVDTVNRVVPEIIASGRYQPPRLGIEISEAHNRMMARQLGVEGVIVMGIEPDSNAQRAGLQPAEIRPDGTINLGDVIQAINGRPVRNGNDLLRQLDRILPGQTIELTIRRRGEQQTITLQMQSSPPR